MGLPRADTNLDKALALAERFKAIESWISIFSMLADKDLYRRVCIFPKRQAKSTRYLCSPSLTVWVARVTDTVISEVT
jgi:hypothetical protein